MQSRHRHATVWPRGRVTNSTEVPDSSPEACATSSTGALDEATFTYAYAYVYTPPQAGRSYNGGIRKLGMMICRLIYDDCGGGGDGGDDNQDDGERMLTMVMTITKV